MSNNTTEEEGQLASETALSEIVDKFQHGNIVHAFGYGSGVFSQNINSNDGNNHEHNNKGLLDIILVVDNAHEFHKTNIATYPNHYASWIRYGGGSSLAHRMQRQFVLRDAKVLFHVVDDPVPMKYGVVHIDDLINDLTGWEHLYLAGRLHKPTLPIGLKGKKLINNSNGFNKTTTTTTILSSSSLSLPDQLVEAQTTNLRSAIAAALLLQAPLASSTHSDDCNSNNNVSARIVPWLELYSLVASLSYAGDFRMQIGGEDPHKVSKLVNAPGQLERFQSTYKPVLRSLEKSGIISCTDTALEWIGNNNNSNHNHSATTTSSANNFLIQQLPVRIQRQMMKMDKYNQNETSSREQLGKILASIVAPAARNQSFKGIFTLGFRKSIQYASAKLSKGLFRK